MPASEPRRLSIAHLWSSDYGIVWSRHHDPPLTRRGWEVWHLCPPGPAVDEALERGAHWAPLELERKFDPWGDLKGSSRLYRTLRQRRFDLIHTHHVKVGLIGRVVAALAGAPRIVHTMHGLIFDLETPQPQRTLHSWAEKVACWKTDRILAQTAEDRRTLIETGAAPAEKILEIGNGIDLERFDPSRFDGEERQRIRHRLGVGPEEVLFLTAGRLVREKGLVELFAGARQARLSDPRIRLAVAGGSDPDKADALDAAVLDEARRNEILLLGQRNDMPALYCAADAFVLASWREGMSRVLMEAAAMGKALVASDVRGCRELVRPPHDGLLVPPRSASALEAALLQLAADPEMRQRMGENNRARARELFDVHVVAEYVASIYESLFAKGVP